jgi:GST-like protein
VLNKQLDGKDYICGAYSIADMLSFPWVRRYEVQGQDLAEFPNVAKWVERMNARPAVARGVAAGAELRSATYSLGQDKEAQKVLFGQRARK